MKKHHFSLLLCLTAAMVVSSCSQNPSNASSGLASSIVSSQAEDQGAHEIYNLYIKNASEKGESPLSYEEWLASIKGEKGNTGATGAQGPQGEKGQDGTSVISGHGAPLADFGSVGDSYIDLDTWDYYVKTASGWVRQGNIKGADGAQGPQGEKGETGAMGAQGPQGETGATGAQGPQGEQGEKGDKGDPGDTPYIKDGYWWIGDTNTGIQAQGPQGEKGENGETGATGAQGPQGEAGSDGTKIYTGNRDPRDPDYEIGTENDLYIDLNTGNIFRRVLNEDILEWILIGNIMGPQGEKGETGETGAQGPQGPQGETGATGAQGPQGETGAQGPQGDPGQQGPQGEKGDPGNKIYSGNGAPSDSSGEYGDYYIDLQTGDIYLCADWNDGSRWGNMGSLKGPKGEKGETGDQGPQGITGATGPQGPQGEDGLTPYIGENGHWWVGEVDTLVNAQGPQGKTGATGLNGNHISTDYGIPSENEGIEGDLYLDRNTWDLYEKVGDMWSMIGNIKGEQGYTGATGSNGSKIYVYSGDPNELYQDLGVYGDFYIDNHTWNLYENVRNVSSSGEIWHLSGNIRGTQLFSGYGVPTLDRAFYKHGDWYLDLETYNLYEYIDSITGAFWKWHGSLKGTSVTSTHIDENGDLIVNLSTGEITNAGHVVDYYTVRYICGDEEVATKKVKSGGRAERPNFNETAGYSVTGWYVYDEGEKVNWKFDGPLAYTISGDTTIYAECTPNQYTIQLVDDAFNQETAPIDVVYNTSFVLPTLTQPGYSFLGWKDDEGNMWENGVYHVPSDTTLHAVWDANSYTVTLDANGGSIDNNSLVVTFDDAYRLPTPTRTNYIFLGWYDGETKVSSSATWKYAEDKLLTAMWTNVSSTYSFDAGDGACDASPMFIGWEDEYELPTPTCPDGYQFDYWSLNGERVEQSGIWNYSASGGILIANYVSNAKYLITKPGYKNTISGISSDFPGGKIIVPDGIENIDSSAFYDCKSLTSIVLPDSVTSIGSRAFSGCSSLSSIVLSSNLASIGYEAFNGCTSLTSIALPNNLTFIGDSAFQSCKSLKTIVIPYGVTRISDRLLFNCTSLTSVVIPHSVTSIRWQPFYNCTSLTSIVFTGTVEMWQSCSRSDFWNASIVDLMTHCIDGDISNQ